MSNSTNSTISSPEGVSPATDMPVAGIILAAVVEIILSVTGTLGNSLTIIAILRNKKLHVVSNFLIVSLAVADLLVSAILVPMRASQHIALVADNGNIAKEAVQAAGFIGRVNIIASISCLGALSIDRCIALSYPLKYITAFRHAKRKVAYVTIVIWTFAILITSVPKFPGVSDKPFLIFFIAFVLLITAVIAVAYYKIFKIATKASRRRGKTAMNVIRFSISTSMNPRLQEAIQKQENQGLQEQKKERKAAKTIGLVIAAFIILVYPRIILLLYHFGAEATSSSKLARFWIRILLYSNSSVNPVLYAWRHKDFRREFKKILRACCHFLACKYCREGQANELTSRSTSKMTVTTTAPMDFIQLRPGQT